jgi:predicted N-acyltransferase
VSHAFLSVLEESGCVGKPTGWLPFPALLRGQSGELLAAAPGYLKLHSQGEYIFDYHWADAYHRLHHDLSYYPKLQFAVPFTPVPGPRLLVRDDLPGEQREQAQKVLLKGFQATAQSLDLSSVHITFCTEKERLAAEAEAGYLGRVGEQYHWFNEGYQSFDDFLARLTSRKRKNIKKERERANAHPVEIHTVHGGDLTSDQCLRFFQMYELTCRKKWGSAYLNFEFFRLLAERMKDRLVLFLVQSKDDGRWVAGAWNLRGDTALFGRNWGCLEHFDLLHFEVCYYRAIDYAIEHGLQRVEAGAQGMHKIQRGYRPRPVHSAHHIQSPPFQKAIAEYLHSERMETEYRLDALTSLEPFKET